MLSARADEVEVAREVVEPVIDAWGRKSRRTFQLRGGLPGPRAADELLPATVGTGYRRAKMKPQVRKTHIGQAGTKRSAAAAVTDVISVGATIVVDGTAGIVEL